MFCYMVKLNKIIIAVLWIYVEAVKPYDLPCYLALTVYLVKLSYFILARGGENGAA